MGTLARSALSIGAAAALLAGCGALPLSLSKGPDDMQPPIGVPGAMPKSLAGSTRDDSASWMARDAASQDLLYVADLTHVDVFSYPAGRYEGTFGRFQNPSGACVDEGGNVYITDYGQQAVFEYAHGSPKRLRAFHPGWAVGCSVDPVNGDLAVANATSNGGVAIYTKARGKPKRYLDPAFQVYYFCGYDNLGNLFVDGNSHSGPYNVVFAELLRGTNKLKTVTLNHRLGYAGGVQWDGTHIAVTDVQHNAVDEVVVEGRHGRLVSKTVLKGADLILQPWIYDGKIIVPNAISGPGSDVLIYRYPAGGLPVKYITGHLELPQAATISKAPRASFRH